MEEGAFRIVSEINVRFLDFLNQFSAKSYRTTPPLNLRFLEIWGRQEGEMPVRTKTTSSETILNARALRHEMTDAESKLWVMLRSHRFEGVHFRRQHPVGPYIADFCSPNVKLVIELDGSQHVDQIAYDRKRTEYLESRGYRVIRFWNHEVLSEMDAVLLAILHTLQE
jgi:very-short-patch-repair endonuclease